LSAVESFAEEFITSAISSCLGEIGEWMIYSYLTSKN
jgi:hypothetical protein